VLKDVPSKIRQCWGQWEENKGMARSFFSDKDMLGKHLKTLGIIKKRPRNTMKKLIMIRGHQVMIGHQENAKILMKMRLGNARKTQRCAKNYFLLGGKKCWENVKGGWGYQKHNK
jgi:hypothetical protein